MKLNPDCVRDVMIYLEDNLGIERNRFKYVELTSILKNFSDKYEKEDLLYSMFQLTKSGYIVTDFSENIVYNKFSISNVLYITPTGHNFISSSKTKNVWPVAKKILGSLGSVSLSVIESVSSGIASSIIEEMINKP